MSMKFPPHASGDSPLGNGEALVTPKQIRERYLFGIDLTDEKGNKMSDKVIQHNINATISFVEHALDITVRRRKFVERYDYRQQDYMQFNFLQTKKRPICTVEEIKARFPNNIDLVKYPEEWYVVENEQGQIQLAPTEGSFNGLVITSKSSYVPLLYGTRDYWPHLFEVTYYAGFEDDCIPYLLNEIVGLQASIGLFEILGDIVLGPGVAGESVGLDGASTTKNLTASAMYNAYSARIESYRKKLDAYMNTVRQYYSGIPMVIV